MKTVIYKNYSASSHTYAICSCRRHPACRAGRVVQLAGAAGKALESKTSTLFAAMQIYHKSCPSIRVAPTRFYESNEIAMADIKRCAALEAKARGE